MVFDQAFGLALKLVQKFTAHISTAEQNHIDIPVYRMDQRSLATLGVQSLPTNMLLDPEGRPVMILRGYSPVVPDEIRRLVSEMDLSEGSDERSDP